MKLDKPALSFALMDCFQASAYSPEIMESLGLAVNELHIDVTLVISILLSRLAHGFQRQKGEIFSFSDSNEKTAISLSMMNQEKLENAPINNLDSERASRIYKL